MRLLKITLSFDIKIAIEEYEDSNHVVVNVIEQIVN